MGNNHALRTLALKLSTSGTAEVLDEQKLYKNSYGFIKLQAYIPLTQNTSAPVCSVFCTTKDEFGVENISTNNYNMLYVGEFELASRVYLLFECYLPKEFTAITTPPSGLKLTINYYDTAPTLDENGDPVIGENGNPMRHTTNLLVSSQYTTTVYPGGWNNQDIELSINSSEAAQISQNMRDIAELIVDVTGLRNYIDDFDAAFNNAINAVNERVDETEEDINGLQGDMTDLTTNLNSKVDKQPNGINDLIDNGKVSTVYLPDAILGALQFQSTWSPANNLPALTATPAPKGYFWICTDDGSRLGLDFRTGDWLLSLGTEWAKVDNTDAVSSVNDKTGAVVLQVNDIVGLRAELDKINYDDRLLTENGETILTEDGLALIIDYLKVVAGLDKVGIAQANIDLSDMADAVFGTLETPIEIYEDSVITFNSYQPVAGYQRAFILYIRRHANVDVDWAGVVKWAYDEIPLLPVGKVQKILIETVDGINFYGIGGDVFNV